MALRPSTTRAARRARIRAAAACAGAALVAAAAFGAGAPASADAGDLLDVVQVGTGSGALSSAATAVSIVPMTGAGVTGTPIAMPTAAAGANKAFTLSGTATSEGSLKLSADGRYLTLAGYGATPGTTSIASSATTSVARVVGRIDWTGAVDTSTALTDAFSANNVRGAVTDDGSRFWVTGAGSSNTVKAGVVYATLGASTSTALMTAASGARVGEIAGGNLFVSSSNTSPTGVSQLGSGLPTTLASPTRISGPSDPYGLAFVTLGSGSTPDTMYVTDGTTGGISKFSLQAGSWTAQGTVGAGTKLSGLAARTTTGGVQLYVTAQDGSKVYSVFDTAGVGAAMTGSLTQVAVAPTNTVYRGIAFAPQNTPPAAVPDVPLPVVVPLGAVVALLGGAWMVQWRRRRTTGGPAAAGLV